MQLVTRLLALSIPELSSLAKAPIPALALVPAFATRAAAIDVILFVFIGS